MDDIEQIVRFCRALGLNTRLQILLHLCGRTLCVGALAARLDVGQSAVSQHLRILRDAGVVSAERLGSFVHYRIDEVAVQNCIDIMERLLLSSIGREECTAGQKGCEKPCVRRKEGAKNRRI